MKKLIPLILLLSFSIKAQDVKIGKQIWTSANLDLVTYSNGDAIPQVQEIMAWNKLTTGAWCYYDNQKANGSQFGFAVLDGRLKGHVDGIITAAPPELGLTFPMLFECKTMADKHWKACVKSGVAVAKPIYAAQISIYQAFLYLMVKLVDQLIELKEFLFLVLF